MEEPESGDICRVCRCEGTADRQLFHPCICTGSIKFIHQECLVQWLRYSKKEFCELCNYRFSFTPIYSPDMPQRIPLLLVLSGLVGTVGRAVKFWLHYTLVAVAWLGVVPLTACRIYRTLFTGSVSTILSLPINVFSTENILTDILQGCAVVTLTLLAFIGLVWLREQILHGGGPAWLEPEEAAGGQQAGANQQENLDNAVVPAEADNEEIIEQGVNLLQNVPEEPPPPEILDPAMDVPGDAGADADQWNPMEWDRAAEELTWERLLGLDGSLVFLEHVFWVVSLNTLFILIFAFCPYHIGHFTVMGFKLKAGVVGVHFSGLLITMTGYCVIGLLLVTLHTISSFLRFRKAARALGLCYVVVKVALLLVAEILAFPVICGVWLDICSLSLFDATLKDRLQSFQAAPWASVFIHWLIGMVYVFYFASFVILLREVLRPGVLWFLRNLNDPDFNPIQEMIHLSLLRHMRRFCASLVMFGTSILVMLYIPARVIRTIIPSFLPYTTQSKESNVDELAMELMLLLVILPAVQDQNQGREWLKFLVKKWCKLSAWLLDLQSYMFGNADGVPVVEEREAVEQLVPVNNEDLVGGLAAAHQAMLQREGPTGFQTYTKPDYFTARMVCLMLLMVFSWLMVSLTMMVIPVCLGRCMFSLWVAEGHRVYELYTAATGLYLCLVLAKGGIMLATWLRQGWTALGHRFKEWAKLAGKAVVAVTLLMGLIPLIFGLLLEVVVLTPVRVPLHQSPLYFIWQDWALGAMYTKITVALTFMGPDWWLKEAIEQLYQDGIRNLNLGRVVKNLVIPSVKALGLSLSIPFLLSHGLAPSIISSPSVLIALQRRIYPLLLLVTALAVFFTVQARQFKKLVEHIKNDRYLVGRRLVNYNHVERNPREEQTVS